LPLDLKVAAWGERAILDAKTDAKTDAVLALVPTYLLQAFFEVKIGVASWVSRGHTQKEVLVMRVVLTVGDERKEFIIPG
jgi:hypothetical protein